MLPLDTVITFTPSELAAWVIGLCAAIVTVSGAVAAIMRAVNKAKEPNKEQDRRIEKLEDRVDRHDELLSNDARHFESLEAGNRVTQKALLALLDHGLDGNNEDQMRKAKDELQQHLIEK